MRDSDNQMSDYELAKLFGENPEDVKKQTEAQAARGEFDIYTIEARVINAARSGGGSITPVGRILCNSFVHVLKSLYDFSETLNDIDKQKLQDLLRKHENFPAYVIGASASYVKSPKR